MNPDLTMKRVGYHFLIIAGGLITGAVLFLGILSIWIGIAHQERGGSWTPLVAGSLGSVVILYLFFRFCRRLFRQMKRTDSIDL